ncbi:unnamed protein product [Bursaphelenchus xylophilus]|nr:unnamed protein product [Bursaphelenchus xylophilus]CAG9128539.1 unnamed protein product [Bursaphelenchus xylophilus]
MSQALVAVIFELHSAKSVGTKVAPRKYDLQLKPKPYLNESCDFYKPDPYHPRIMKFVDEKYIPKCTPQYEVVTSIINGTLMIRKKEFSEFGHWSYRCLKTVGHANFTVEAWVEIERPDSAEPHCDVVEVKAEKDGQRFYQFVHVQIYKQYDIRLSSEEAPSVHIIVMDTVSSPNFVRSMKKTKRVLEEKLGGIHLPYLNKVGHGSIVNAWSFLFGHSPENGSETIWGPGLRGMPPTRKKFLNPFYIGTAFQRKQYRTLLSEDDVAPITCYQGCKGLVNPADHWMAAYNKRVNYDNPNNTDLLNFNETIEFRRRYEESCVETYTTLLNTLDQFINTYNHEAQFSMTWMTKMAHDDINLLYHVDNDFAEFFEKNVENLKNSFVFLMADHGTRYGAVTEEPLAKYEDFNPTLMVTLPESLRKDEKFREVLRENAKELISHHDVYASLQDIVWSNGQLSDPSTEIYRENVTRQMIGSSFFRPLPQPRNCFTLKIPQNYCMCQKIARVEINSEMGIKIAEKSIEMINNELIDNNFTDICVRHYLNNQTETQLIEYDNRGINGEKVVLVLFMTYPANARYGAHALVQNGNFQIQTEFFNRMNEYFWQSQCLSTRIYRDYCYCKEMARMEGYEVA